jgi:eukaryotic-like serine/threonine-protein kinase
MPERARIHPRVTAPGSGTSGAHLTVPDDLMEASGNRLQIAAMVWVGLWGIGLVMNHLVRPLIHLPSALVLDWPPLADVFAVIAIGLSLALVRFAPRIRGERLVTVGLSYEVAMALAVGIVNQWNPAVLGGRLSWLCVLILIHPMIVPATPRKTLVASLLAASMDPVGLIVAHLRGLELPVLPLLVWAYLPNYVCALLAVVPAQILRRLARQVSQARELGSYRLVNRIGSGGMGEVWRADHRLLARPAAIKLIRPARDRAQTDEAVRLATARFRREAQAAASLRSPHTIQLYDFGVTRDGRFYIVMELLEGVDLETLVRRFGPLPPARVVRLLLHACHSLAEAHATGLVHRDIKPANLHLSRVGLEHDFLKILDFGLAKRDERSSSAQTLLTAPEATTGTPAYMPPELASGGAIDGRVDLYALGCVGYFLLTGRQVFEGETALQMILQHIQRVPVRPSEHSEMSMPAALDDLIMTCLSKEPEHRPSSAEELASALSAITLEDCWTDEDARTWWQEHAASFAPPPPSTEGTVALDLAY